MYLLISLDNTRPAIIQALINLDDIPDVELSSQDWRVIEKVIRVLRPFEEATRELSKHEASISQCIPVVTSLVKSLEMEASEDTGVLTMKRELRLAMIDRFSGMEKEDCYVVSTLLDSRYKHHLYRDPSAFSHAKASIVDQIVKDLRENYPQVCSISVQVCIANLTILVSNESRDIVNV